jgi:hypothetical protein
MIYLKSFLTGLATLCAAGVLAGLTFIAQVWMSSEPSPGFFAFAVDGSRIAGPVLTASLLIFAAGFTWQYLRRS